MKSKLRTILLSCVATSLAAGTSLFSQSNEAVSIGVRALVLGEKSELSERYIQTKEGHELLTLSARQAGKPIETFSDGNLRLYREVDDELGKKSYLAAEVIPIPQGARDILLLTWGTPDGQRYRPIDDKYSQLTRKDWLMINTTSKAIGFKIGEDNKPVFLRPNMIDTYKVEATTGLGAPVIGRAKKGDKIKTFYSVYWPIRESERNIVIFTEQNGRIDVQRVGDRVLRGPEEE